MVKLMLLEFLKQAAGSFTQGNDGTSERLGALILARTTESMFHKKIIYMLTPGDKGPFEKCRNTIFSDFDGNWRKISKFEKDSSSKSTCHF